MGITQAVKHFQNLLVKAPPHYQNHALSASSKPNALRQTGQFWSSADKTTATVKVRFRSLVQDMDAKDSIAGKKTMTTASLMSSLPVAPIAVATTANVNLFSDADLDGETNNNNWLDDKNAIIGQCDTIYVPSHRLPSCCFADGKKRTKAKHKKQKLESKTVTTHVVGAS